MLVGIFFIFLWNLNLSDLDTLMANRYSDFGPPPKEKPQKAEKKVEKVIVKDLLDSIHPRTWLLISGFRS